MGPWQCVESNLYSLQQLGISGDSGGTPLLKISLEYKPSLGLEASLGPER